MLPLMTLYYTVSIDGFIADSDDNGPWPDSSWQLYISNCKEVGNLVMGRRTYELFLRDNDFVCTSFNTLTVVSSSLAAVENGFTCVKSPEEAYSRLCELQIERALIIGGASTAGSFLNAELIDYLRLDIEPIALGEGIPMFRHLTKPAQLALVSSEQKAHGCESKLYEVIAPKKRR